MNVVITALKEVYGLVVEDGFVAIGAIVSIAIAYLLSHESLVGPVPVIGFLLFVMLSSALAVSLRRAARPPKHPAG